MEILYNQSVAVVEIWRAIGGLADHDDGLSDVFLGYGQGSASVWFRQLPHEFG
jgi:hypothetical protein